MSVSASGNHGAAARGKHLRVLLPFSCDNLRIPDELAEEIDGGEALVVSPSGKVWHVDVRRDGDGAFLGRGWPDFVAACGAGAGWLVLLRHQGRGVLTVKAFDATCCLREPLGTHTPSSVEAKISGKEATRRPQFFGLLPSDSMDNKMEIPPEFVQRYMSKQNLDNVVAVVLGPRGKVWHIGVKIDQLGLFFSKGWAEFLEFHGITKDNALLFRYEGNMVFTVKVFEPDGCQRESEHKNIRIQQSDQMTTVPEIGRKQEAPIQKRKSKNDWTSSDREKKPNGSMASFDKASLPRKSIFEIGPQLRVTKHINSNTLKRLALPQTFCHAIKLSESCKIMLKTSINSTKCWHVHGLSGKNGSYLFERGWKRFCQENRIMEGDICTFNVIETTTWHVHITHQKNNINQQGTTCASINKRKRKNDCSVTGGSKRPKRSLASLNKASGMRCKYDIGPPSWVEKKMNSCSIENHLSLPAVFCDAIGIREACTVTLKTSLNSTRAWQVRIHPYKNCSHHLGSGWKSFCQDNRLKVGDVCTINIVETMLWQVTIARQ